MTRGEQLDLFQRAATLPRAVPVHSPVVKAAPPPRPIAAVKTCAESVRAKLEEYSGQKIALRINDNRSTVFSFRPRGGVMCLSLHRFFLAADDEVLRALGQHLRRPTARSQRVLRAFINNQPFAPVEAASVVHRRLKLRARGHVYDLHRLAAEVNAEFFENALEFKVTWGRGEPVKRRRRHIVFGSYDHRLKLIRMHPALDSHEVPEFFVRFVLFHEMLHAVLEPEKDGDGRRCVHTREFRRREKQHPDYDRAMKWERLFMKGEHC